MNLSEVPTVVFDLINCDKVVGDKFFASRLVDETGATKVVVRTDSKLSHRKIWKRLEQELDGSGIRAGLLGGGYIWVDSVNNEILIHGGSTDFCCEPDRTQTVQLVQAEYPNFRVRGIS